ncbi:hypothetical protein RB195_015374 [Necator americanus]|uniref:Secreted protein n=1 Tax=Necator americanus TaxID=51031 RepID=A0ABR1E4T9_NECAM
MFSRATIVILALCITIAVACHGGSHPKSHGSKIKKCKSHGKGSGSESHEEDCVTKYEGDYETTYDTENTDDKDINVKVTVSPGRR